MKTKAVRCLAAALLLALPLSSCRFRAPVNEAASPQETAAATPASVSAVTAAPVPTQEPTQAPTPSPTAEPTPEPTAAPVTSAVDAVTVVGGIEVFPYLLPGESDTVMLVRWTGKATDETLTVLYGEDDGSGTIGADAESVAVTFRAASRDEAADHPLFYEARMEVQADTRYVYGVSINGEAPAAVYPFRTPRTDGCFTAMFASDTHIEFDRPARVFSSAAETALEMALDDDRGLDGIFHMGDMGDRLDSRPSIMIANTPLLHSIPITAVVGNHDSLGAITAHFPAPHKDERTWDYWFVRGGVLFIGMNIRSYDFVGHESFLRSIPEQAGEHDWTVVMLHYSMRSNGNHGIDQAVFNYWYYLSDAFSDLDADLIISGHDHEYDRTPLMTPEGPVDGSGGSEVIKNDGEMLFVCVPSTTGVKYYSRNIVTDYPMAAEGLESEPGFVLAEFSPEELRIRVVNVDTGETEDEFVLRREEAA